MDKQKRAIISLSFFATACLGTEEPKISGLLITPECFRDFDCGWSIDLPCMVPVCNPLTFTCGLVRPDEDEDGHPDMYCGGNDCDDRDYNVFPGGKEVCDNIDNNCNGGIDEELDCNGVVATREVCDGLDNDLDGVSDEGLYTLDNQVMSLYSAKKTPYVGLNAGYIYAVHLRRDNRVGARVYAEDISYTSSYNEILPEEEWRTLQDVTMHGAHIYILASYNTGAGAFLKWRAFDYINETYIDSAVVAGVTQGSIIATEDYVFVATYNEETDEVKWLVFDEAGSLISEHHIGTYDDVGKVAFVDCNGGVGVLILSAVGSTLGKIEYFSLDPLASSVGPVVTLISLVESQSIYDFDFMCPQAVSSSYLAIMAGTAVPGDDRVTLFSLLIQYDENLAQLAQIDLIPPAFNIYPPSDENPYTLTVTDAGFSLGVTLASWDRLRFRQFEYNLGAMIAPMDLTTSSIISGPMTLWLDNRFAIFWGEDVVSTDDEMLTMRHVHCEDG